MGILQAAYKTYEVYEQKAGLKESGMEVLTPVSHMLQKAEIEVTITRPEMRSAPIIISASQRRERHWSKES